MASLVIKAMVQGGVKVLMGCEPTSIEKDETSGLLTVTWTTSGKEQMCDQFDTVLMAAGQLCQHLDSAVARGFYHIRSVVYTCPSIPSGCHQLIFNPNG